MHPSTRASPIKLWRDTRCPCHVGMRQRRWRIGVLIVPLASIPAALSLRPLAPLARVVRSARKIPKIVRFVLRGHPAAHLHRRARTATADSIPRLRGRQRAVPVPRGRQPTVSDQVRARPARSATFNLPRGKKRVMLVLPGDIQAQQVPPAVRHAILGLWPLHLARFRA